MRVETCANLEEGLGSLGTQGDHSNAPVLVLSPSDEKVASLENTVQQLRTDLDTLTRQSNEKIFTLENTVHQLRAELADSRDNIDNLSQVLHAHDRKHEVRSLITSAIEVVKTNKDLPASVSLLWKKLETRQAKIEHYHEALVAYSTALSLASSTPHALLLKWATMMLRDGPADEAVDAATHFDVYRAICDVLEENCRVTEATQCFQMMQHGSMGETSACEERARWEAGG
ncbi:hypothetical protein JVU11DRAFT_10171 [Chiua virens]|nr:hypothetical protein JVU11DRAFT_10171 [Chiua virens]